MQDLGTLGGPLQASAYGINNAGKVVGDAGYAFVWSAKKGTQDLGTLQGGASAVASGINNAGRVVGEALFPNTSGGFLSHAFLWTAANGMQDLGTLGGIFSGATAINDAGSVVGYSLTPAPVSAHAFLWTAANGMQDLGTLGGDFCPALAINNAGWVVGEAHVGPDFPFRRAFLWTAANGIQDIGTLGGIGAGAGAYGINNAGQVVGWSSAESGATSGAIARHHAVVWTAANGMQDLGTLGGRESVATGINEAGLIVGWAHTASGESHACVWKRVK